MQNLTFTEFREVSMEYMQWVRIPLETYIFILNFSIPACSEQLSDPMQMQSSMTIHL